MSGPARTPREPHTPGRCDGCGGPLPDQPDPRLVASRDQVRLCSTRCRNRLGHRRAQRRWQPETTREQECGRKRGYDTRAEADAVIGRYGRADTTRSYLCPWCGRWHAGRYVVG